MKPAGSRAYNPRDPEMRAAAKLYESFRERTPRRIKKVGIAVPRIAVDIGHVEYIGYRTTHGKKLTLYQHDFGPGSRPLLCVSPDGRQLLLLGGRYVFTERGIVDRDIEGREIENDAHGKPMRSNPRARDIAEGAKRTYKAIRASASAARKAYIESTDPEVIEARRILESKGIKL